MKGSYSTVWRRASRHTRRVPNNFFSQKVFLQSSCKSQFPHMFDNFFFELAIIKDKLTDVCGN